MFRSKRWCNIITLMIILAVIAVVLSSCSKKEEITQVIEQESENPVDEPAVMDEDTYTNIIGSISNDKAGIALDRATIFDYFDGKISKDDALKNVTETIDIVSGLSEQLNLLNPPQKFTNLHSYAKQSIDELLKALNEEKAYYEDGSEEHIGNIIAAVDKTAELIDKEYAEAEKLIPNGPNIQ